MRNYLSDEEWRRLRGLSTTKWGKVTCWLLDNIITPLLNCWIITWFFNYEGCLFTLHHCLRFFFFNKMLQEWDELPKPGLKPRSRPGLVFPLWGRTVGRQDGEGITLLLLGGWGVCEPLQGVTSAIITWDSFRPHNFNSKIFLFFFFFPSQTVFAAPALKMSRIKALKWNSMQV